MAAVYGTWGVEKVFFHAGVCGTLNGRSGAGIFFEYGGAPRKMYPALAALSRQSIAKGLNSGRGTEAQEHNHRSPDPEARIFRQPPCGRGRFI